MLMFLSFLNFLFTLKKKHKIFNVESNISYLEIDQRKVKNGQ